MTWKVSRWFEKCPDDLKSVHFIWKPTKPNQTYQTKPNMKTKPNLPNPTYQTKPAKPNLPNQTEQTEHTKPNQT